MLIAEAQREVRRVYRSGVAGLLVSAAVWAVSAAFATWVTARSGIIVMLLGGFFIYPLTQVVLKLLGGPASLPGSNPLRELAIEVAVVGPLMLPLVGAAALHRAAWFYPAFMVAIGSHYLPFAFLYGMRSFVVLGILMLVAGLAIGLYLPWASSAGAWFTAGLLLVFGLLHLRLWRGETAAVH